MSLGDYVAQQALLLVERAPACPLQLDEPSMAVLSPGEPASKGESVDYRESLMQLLLLNAVGQGEALNQMAVIGRTGIGKTRLLEQLAILFLMRADEYDCQDPASIPSLEKMEGYKRWMNLPGTDASRLHVIKTPDYYLAPNADRTLLEVDLVEKQMGYVPEYKLEQGYQFESTGIVYPKSNGGGAGSNTPCRQSYGSCFQVLLHMQSLEVCESQCISFLELKVNTPSLLSDKEQKFLERQWMLLTGSAEYENDLKSYRSSPETYQVPLLNWVKRIASHSFLFHSGVPGMAPNQLIELTFISAVMHICMQHGDKTEYTQAQKMLLDHLMQADPTGPWEELSRSGHAGMQHVREAFVSCIEYTELFLPNWLLKALGLQLLDSLGWDDGNPRRTVLQRELEEGLMHVVFMVEKQLASTESIMTQLPTSPVMQRWLSGRLDPESPTPPTISFMLYREKEGHKLPPRTSVRGEQVTLRYVLEEEQYLTREMESLTATIRGELTEIVRRMMDTPAAPGPAEASTSGDGATPESAVTAAQPSRASSMSVQSLVDNIPIFYAFPMLGATIHAKIYEICRGDSSVQERLLQDVADGIRWDAKSKGPLTLEHLQRACNTTHVADLLGLMTLPLLRSIKTTLETAATAVDELHATVQQLSASAPIVVEPKNQGQSFSAHSKRWKFADIHDSIGMGSTYGISINTMFKSLCDDVLRPCVGQAFDKAVMPMVSSTMDRVAKRLVDKFLLTNDTRCITLLLNALQPSNMWQHGDAPLSSFMRKGLAGLDLSPVVDVVRGQYQESFMSRAEELVGDKVYEIYTSKSIVKGDSSEIKDKIVHKGVLQQGFSFEKHLRYNCHKAFFGAARKNFTKHYRSIIQIQLDAVKLASRGSLYDKLQQVARQAEGQTAEQICTAIAKALREWFSSFAVTLSNNLKHSLLAHLEGKNTDLKMYVYERAMSDDTRLKNLRPSSILAYVPKMCVEVLQRRHTSSDISLKSVCGHLQGLSGSLGSLLNPAKLVEGAPASIRKMLQQAFVAAQCYDVGLGATGLLQQASVVELRKAPEGQNFLRGNGRADADQIAAFNAEIQRMGASLLECPGNGDCGYYSILHQTLGIMRDANNTEAADSVHLHRQLVASYLEHSVEQERALGVREGHMSVLEAILGGEERSAEEGARLVAEHIRGVRLNAHITYLEIHTLAELLRNNLGMPISVTVYSPSLSAETGFKYELLPKPTGIISGMMLEVLMANVSYSGGPGQLNHWKVVALAQAEPTNAGGTRGLRRQRNGQEEAEGPDEGPAAKRLEMGSGSPAGPTPLDPFHAQVHIGGEGGLVREIVAVEEAVAAVEALKAQEADANRPC